MAKTKVGAPRGRGQGTGGRGGRGGDAKDEGKRPATRGGYLKLSKPAGNPTATDGGSPPLSKANGKRTAADGGSPPLSKADGKRPAAAGGSQSVSKTQHKYLAPAIGTKRLAAHSGPNLARQDKDAASPTTRVRDVPLQYPPLSNRPAPPAFRLSPELNLNLQPGSREIEKEEEEDEEDDEEGGDDAVEDMEVQYEHVVHQEPEGQDYQQLLDDVLALPGRQTLPLLSHVPTVEKSIW
ncbi:hypothetical protein AALP_AAs48852U000100 [Arabis alpina]|uniref:Uncharacterized protein n=1 Tax=Arabis alpina TaxID=50452 RepID=A0A087G364_ARAAL|nr:hypothetical protein AALP_AAs48852U000100 [Arabis alpina]